MIEIINGKEHVSSYVRRTKLPGLMGRINYISNPNRQDFGEDFYNMEDKDFWKQLASQSKDTEDYNKDKKTKKGKPYKPTQAIEYIVRLSPEMYDKNNESLMIPAKEIADSFYKKFGYKCCVAVHHSSVKDENKKPIKDENGNYIRNYDNLHCHIIICDREIPKERIRKIAKRDIYFDSNGKRVYRKDLADPTKTIKKGECYKDLRFGSKIEELRDAKAFNEKMHEWSNEFNNKYSVKQVYYHPKNVGRGKDYEHQWKEGNKRKPEDLRNVINHNKAVRQLNMVKHFIADEKGDNEGTYTNKQLFKLIDTRLPKAGEKYRKTCYQMACYLNKNKINIRNEFPYCNVKGFESWISTYGFITEADIREYRDNNEYSNSQRVQNKSPKIYNPSSKESLLNSVLGDVDDLLGDDYKMPELKINTYGVNARQREIEDEIDKFLKSGRDDEDDKGKTL